MSTDEKGPDPASPQGVAQRWIRELDLAQSYWSDYHKRCEKILARYEDDRKGESDTKRKFNIFWSNIETLKPACYARVPAPVVLRRYRDPDPVARVASEVLERAIGYSMDSYDFDQTLKHVRDEFLLLAKGHGWVRYVPTLEDVTDEPEAAPEGDTREPEAGEYSENQQEAAAAEPRERLVSEDVVCDYVAYDDWGTNKARNWEEVRYVWRRVYLTRAQLKARFAKHGPAVPLDWKPDKMNDAEAEMFAKACIYEIWDKESKKVVWVSKGYNAAPLDEKDDPLGLKDFFPCPKPALGTVSPRSIIPIPDYIQYQDQADEVDRLTAKINKLTDGLKVVGLYAGEQKAEIEAIAQPECENRLVPVEDWMQFSDKGGLKGLVEWWPVQQVVEVLASLYEARQKAIEVIYQITGISDIMRGDTDPNETAAAQGLKSTWGSSRVREKQKEIARFCRDLMRIKGEIIAEKFDIATIRQMTNYKLLTQEEKAQAQMMLKLHEQKQQQAQMMAQMMAQQGGQQPQPLPPPLPPEVMGLLDLPTWEEVDQLLKSEGMRNFRVDIESDSTVEPDLLSDKRDATEFITAMGGLLQQSMVAVQQAPPLGKVVAEMAKYVTRRFQAGREMEEVIEKALDEIAAMPPPQPEEQKQTGKSPEEIAVEQEKNQVAREKNQVSAQKIQADELNSQRDHESEVRASEAETIRAQADVEIAREGTRTAVAQAAAKPPPVAKGGSR